MKYYTGSNLLQALFAPPVLVGAVLAALIAWAWQRWRLRSFHRVASLDGTVCLAGPDGEAVIRPAPVPSLVGSIVIGALLGSLFNSAISRGSPDFPFYYASTAQDYSTRCEIGMPAGSIRCTDLSSVLLLAAAVLGVTPLISRPRIRVSVWPGAVERRRWFRTQRFGLEECARLDLITETRVYYGAGHLVDLGKIVEIKADLELVLKDRTRLWLGRISGKNAESRAAAAAGAFAIAIGIPLGSGA